MSFADSTFSFDQCVPISGVGGVNGVKMFDFLWLQIFAKLTGGEIVSTPTQLFYAKYTQGMNVLLVFPNANQAKMHQKEVIDTFAQGTRFQVGYVKGYEGMSLKASDLEVTNLLPFFFVGDVKSYLRVTGIRPQQIDVTLFL